MTFAVRWFGVLTVRGWFREVTGWIRPMEGNGAEISVDVASASVTTGIALRDRHLRGPRFLDAATHSVISFRGTGTWRDDGQPAVSGIMQLRGIDRRIEVSCRVAAQGEKEGQGAGLLADFTIPRLPHGIGSASGLSRFNPLLRAISASVDVRVKVFVPATFLRPEPVLARGR